MRRNKRFRRDKKLLRIDRERNEFYKLRRKSIPTTVQYDTGYRRDVSKTMCPGPLYKDLRGLIDKIAVVESDYRYERGFCDLRALMKASGIDDYGIIYKDPMLRDLTDTEYTELPPAQRRFLRKETFTENANYRDRNRRWGVHLVTYNVYRLCPKYYNYLYIRRAPMYCKRWYDDKGYDDWGGHNSAHERLNNHIESHNLHPKIMKAASKSYRYDDWGIERRLKQEKEAKIQFREDIADGLEDAHYEILYRKAIEIREKYGQEALIKWLMGRGNGKNNT